MLCELKLKTFCLYPTFCGVNTFLETITIDIIPIVITQELLVTCISTALVI